MLTITGTNFGGGEPLVTLGDPTVALHVLSFGVSQITADVVGVPPGSYLLTVSRGSSTTDLAVFEATIGAVGLQGVQGEKGDKGDPGGKGDPGDDGSQGPIGPAGISLWSPNGDDVFYNSGNVGVGITTPDPKNKLSVFGPWFNGVGGSQLKIHGRTSGTGGTPELAGLGLSTESGTGEWIVYRYGSIGRPYSNHFCVGINAKADFLCISSDNGKVGIGVQAPTHPLEMKSGAYVTAGGVWTSVSSRALKAQIRDLPEPEALTALQALNPVTFAYTANLAETHVGFIAEDVPGLVAMNDRKGLAPMDIVAVLTKVVQQQQDRIDALEARLSALEHED